MSKRVVAVAAVVLAIAAQAWAGVYYEAVTKGEGRGTEAMASTVKAWVNGDKARIEFVESGNPMMAKGGYMVTEDAGKNLFFVDPEAKTYSRFDIESLGQLAGGMTKMMNMKISDPKVEDLGEQPGGMVAGLPTIHYRYRTSYTMAMSFMGMKMNNAIVQEQDIWSAPTLLEAALGIWTKRTPPSFGNEEFDKLIKAEMAKVKGFPLKMVTKQTTTDKNGKSQTTTTTMEVTKLELDLIPNVSFTVPAGYKEVDMLGGAAGQEGEGGQENPLAKMFGKKKS